MRVNVSGGAKSPGGSSRTIPRGNVGETASAPRSSCVCPSRVGRAGKRLGSSQPAPQSPQLPAHAEPSSQGPPCLSFHGSRRALGFLVRPQHTARLSSSEACKDKPSCGIFPSGTSPLGTLGRQEKPLPDSDCCSFSPTFPVYCHLRGLLDGQYVSYKKSRLKSVFPGTPWEQREEKGRAHVPQGSMLSGFHRQMHSPQTATNR